MATPNPFGNPAANEDENVFELDLTNESGSTTIPEGDYPAKLIGVEKTTSKSSGNPMWVWEFMITKGNEAGTTFKYFTVITPSALWKLVETLEALGIGGFGKNISFKPEEIIGTEIIITVVDDEYNGVTRSSITKVAPSAAGAGSKAAAPGVPTPEKPAKAKSGKGPK